MGVKSAYVSYDRDKHIVYLNLTVSFFVSEFTDDFGAFQVQILQTMHLFFIKTETSMFSEAVTTGSSTDLHFFCSTYDGNWVVRIE